MSLTVWPKDSTPTPTSVVKQAPPPKTLEVIVGPSRVTFRIDWQAASATSRFFRAASSREDDPSSASSPPLPSRPRALRLPNQDPTVFRLYEQWLAAQPRPEPLQFRPGECSAEPWFSLAAQAYVLGSRLRCWDFERYALSQLMQNCAAMPFGPWKYIEEIPQRYGGRPLKRFANHWVAWNCSLVADRDGTLPQGSEYIGLKAAALVSQVTEEGTPDPRLVDLDHWFKSCSDTVAPECPHSPLVRQRKQDEELAAVLRHGREVKRKRDRRSSESYLYESKLQADSSTD